MTILHESAVPEVAHPGRFMRWLASEDALPAKKFIGLRDPGATWRNGSTGTRSPK